MRAGKIAVDVDDLARINDINAEVYRRLGRPADPAGGRLPYRHPYFVSKTRFEDEQYTAESIATLLGRLGVTAQEYRRERLFVLRSTVMNHHYGAAERDAGKDYLREFVASLHRVARAAVDATAEGRPPHSPASGLFSLERRR